MDATKSHPCIFNGSIYQSKVVQPHIGFTSYKVIATLAGRSHHDNVRSLYVMVVIFKVYREFNHARTWCCRIPHLFTVGNHVGCMAVKQLLSLGLDNHRPPAIFIVFRDIICQDSYIDNTLVCIPFATSGNLSLTYSTVPGSYLTYPCKALGRDTKRAPPAKHTVHTICL